MAINYITAFIVCVSIHTVVYHCCRSRQRLLFFYSTTIQ